MLQHDVFLAPIENLCYDWIVSDSEDVEEVVSKVFTIFVERSHSLYSDEETLMWLREIIGYTLNKIDAGDIDPDLLSAQLQSGIVDTKFTWARYRQLKKHDFMDDLTVVAPQELLGGGEGNNNMPHDDGEAHQIPVDAARQQQQNLLAEQQLNQMIN